MVEQWTGVFIGKMHCKNISSKDFAQFIGYSPEYVSKVLNGKRNPKDAEKRFNEALDKLIKERSKK